MMKLFCYENGFDESGFYRRRAVLGDGLSPPLPPSIFVIIFVIRILIKIVIVIIINYNHN